MILSRVRFPTDPAAHTALGYFLLSGLDQPTSNGGSASASGSGVETLDRVTAVFRRALNVSQGDAFVPATRGLAVASRRKRASRILQEEPEVASREEDAMDGDRSHPTKVHKND